MVRPQLEYASAVWDPYHIGDISELEKVQRRAARWVLNDYGRFSSVSLMLDQLKWSTLQIRRRLQILHKIHYQQLSLQIPHYYLPKTRPTRQYHHLHYILPTSSTTAYQNSYFSRTINEWNILYIYIYLLMYKLNHEYIRTYVISYLFTNLYNC